MRGFTLIEMIVFVVMVSVALLGFMAGFRATQERAPEPLLVVRANELAYMYLEEIMSRPYDQNDTEDTSCSDVYFGTGCTAWGDFGPDGETRSGFDDVDDYHLLVEGSARLGEDGITQVPNPACTGFADIAPADLGPAGPRADAARTAPYYTASPTVFPLDAEARPRDEYYEFCVEITVHYDGDYDNAPNTDGTGIEAKRIRIRVSHPFVSTVIVSAYRASY